jgi:hypothetical protein
MRFNSQDPQGHVQAETLSQSRHESYFRHYFQWLDEEQPTDLTARQVTIIARSPLSPVIQTLSSVADELSTRQIAVQVVFSDVDPENALRDAWTVISDLSKNSEHGDLIRWANSPGVLEAHEQMILGQHMCWLGDAMRREPGRRDGFDMFDTDAPRTCRLGIQSFAAMWKFATPVPKWLLREVSDRRPNATFAGPDQRALVTLSFFRSLQKPDTLCH